MKWQTLTKLDTEDLGRAADVYKSLSSAGDRGKDGLNKNVAPGIRGKLKGRAANAALRQVGQLSDNFHYMQVQTGLIRTNIDLLQEILRKAKIRLNQALQEAEREGFTVESDGSVSYSSASPEDDDGNKYDGGTAHGADSEKRKALAIAQEISEAVGQATEADKTFARVLRRLKADDELHVSSGDWNDTAADTKASRKAAAKAEPYLPQPPEGRSSQENKQWWDLLSDEDRDHYLALYPAEIGALDGLPADIRDEANRAEMATTKGRYETELNQLLTEKPPGWKGRRDHINDTLKGIEAIESRFDRTGIKELPPAYLLGFDPKGRGDGRIILANGNPDTADHTAIHVPGTTAKLSAIDGDLHRVDRLWRHSSKSAGPDASVSTITWLDYDAPDINPGHNPMRGKFADEGADPLRRFTEGTQAAQGGADASHTTVSGHSYGSAVVGEAAKGHRLPADDIMFQGSPGVHVRRAEDLGVGADHVWAVAADKTVDDTTVRQGGRAFHGGGPDRAIPTDQRFGGNVMDYGPWRGPTGHGKYWDEERDGDPTVSLRNMARVVAGDYINVTHKQ
ncbi:alpha/beta hydrolase [Streptomyces sp. NBC_01187]|uniref:alpha/beta hydrolase n=1 Tax=Streptomyces sp. NBC_01187 TaxID=2903766 RepID=UPI00386728C3|nr:alpha/beta hydrolase family protein [Streptomyces sp. NBC_01187]